jgi:hypothetical protein
MAGENKQLSLDEQAADLAATMNFEGAGAPLEKGGAAGDMPQGQTSAEGGFTKDAGGQVITAGVEGAVQKGGAKTGAAMTSEPSAQNTGRKTGSAMTSEPGRAAGGGAGEGGNLSQSGDEMRARKAGQVGVGGGSTGGGNLSENEDAAMRGRKGGKVGISKAEAFDLGLSKAQYEALMEKGLVKADDEDDDEGDDEKEASCKKGEVTPDELEKSLQSLEAIAAGAAIPTSEDRRTPTTRPPRPRTSRPWRTWTRASRSSGPRPRPITTPTTSAPTWSACTSRRRRPWTRSRATSRRRSRCRATTSATSTSSWPRASRGWPGWPRTRAS